MINRFKKYAISIGAAFYSLVVALFWLALRVNWSGISKALGADNNQSFLILQLPLMVCILLWVIFALNILALFLLSDKKWVKITSLSLSMLFSVLIAAVVALGAIDYIQYILAYFAKSLLISLLLIFLSCLLFFPTTSKSTLVITVKSLLLVTAIIISVFLGYKISIGTRFTYDPVVYAVEDEYQIVFSTNDSAIAWVEIGGEKYYDLFAGSMKSTDKVHKITVPQSVLDSAGAYSVNAQKMIYRGPFGGYLGKEISKEYSFRPVNADDGLVYYSMSDVHHSLSGAVNTALSVKDLDFLIMLGDNVDMVDRDSDAQFANLVAHNVTKGEIPVVYVRGNHEIKGRYAEELYKYVGSTDDGGFYYWFTLGNVFGITLDLGEDHDDDWWEYYGTAQFKLYQQEQIDMLEELIEAKPYDSYDYTLVACHIPIQFINSRHNHVKIKTSITELLNQISPDLAVYGHQHDLYPFLVGQKTMYNDSGKLVYNSQFAGREGKTYGGYLTDYTFDGFIVGRRGSEQQDEIGSFNKSEHVGMVTVVDLLQNKQTCTYINSHGEIVEIYNPFEEGDANTVFELPLG